MTTLLSDTISCFKALIRILLLSLYSIKFYQDVYKSYTGFGIKYIFTISFCSSLFLCTLLLQQIYEVRNYLVNETLSKNVINLDHIISQFPDLNYDGDSILNEEENIIFLTNTNNKAVVAIDPQSKLSANIKAKIPVIFSDKKLLVSLIDKNGKIIYSKTENYSELFGHSSQVINQSIIKKILTEGLAIASTLLIYAGFPVTGLMIFLYSIFEKSFMIVIIYFLANMLSIITPLKTCIRMIFFSSGIFFLLQPLIILLFPNFSIFTLILQIWCNILMVMGILKANNRFN